MQWPGEDSEQRAGNPLEPPYIGRLGSPEDCRDRKPVSREKLSYRSDFRGKCVVLDAHLCLHCEFYFMGRSRFHERAGHVQGNYLQLVPPPYLLRFH